MKVLVGSAHNTKTTASAVSFSAILSCEISDFGQQLSVLFVWMVLLRARQQNS